MKCGATGRECPHTCTEGSECPCSVCETGKEFRKQWAGQPELADDN